MKMLEEAPMIHYNPFARFSRHSQQVKQSSIDNDYYRPVFGRNNIYEITPLGIAARDAHIALRYY